MLVGCHSWWCIDASGAGILGGLTVTDVVNHRTGGLTIDAGGLTVALGGASMTNRRRRDSRRTDGHGCWQTITAGGLTIEAGGLTVTSLVVHR
jgi:hypothetical protein